MTLTSFSFNPFQTNCYICHDEGEAVLIDPGCLTEQEQQVVVEYLEEHDLTLRHLLLTHAHIDHIFGCAFFAEKYGQSFLMHRADVPFIQRSQEQALLFGLTLEPPPIPERFLDEGDTIRFGSVTWEVLLTPGHSPGSICFYDAEQGLVISGDVLFMGSIGRTDLPGGSLSVLMQSIFQQLVPLGDETVVYPGHGPSTTIGRERQTNPFLVGAFPHA
ncbi:MAG: MBL fold metallo-hydrolase [Rhodothermales bacterium]